MGRFFVCSLVLCVFLCGFGCSEKPNPQAQQQPGPAPQEVDPQDAGRSPKKQRANVPPLVLDVPPALPPFSGMDLPPETPIPAEVQAKLDSTDNDYVAGLSELALTSPYPKVRERALSRLDVIDEAKRPQVIPALRGALADSNKEVAYMANYVIRNWKAKDALGELVAHLYHPDSDMRERVLETLSAFSELAAPAAPQLFMAFEDNDYPSKYELINVIGKLGPAGKPMVPKLVDLMNKEFLLGREAAEALGRLGEEEPLLLHLTQPDVSRREHAAMGARNLPTCSPEMTEALVQVASQDKHENIRFEAAMALGKVRPTTPAIAAAMLKSLSVDSRWNRESLIEALGNCEPKLPEVSTALLKVSQEDPEDAIRKLAAVTLSKFEIGPATRLATMLEQAVRESSVYLFSDGLKEKSDELLPVMLKIASDPQAKPAQRAAAILALRHLPYLKEDADRKKREAEFAALLKPILQNSAEPAAVRVAAREALGQRDLIPDEPALWLEGLKQTDSAIVRIDAANHFEYDSMRDPAAIPVLIQMLQDKNPKVAEAAIETLAKYTQAADAAIKPSLEQLQNNKDANQYKLIYALGEIGTQPDLSVPVLQKMLAAKNSHADDAAIALAKIIVHNDLEAAPFVPQIVSLLNGEDGYSKGDYLTALGILGPKAASAIPDLLTHLEHKNESVRQQSIRALADMGPAAAPAVPALLKAAGNKDPQRADDVTEAIKTLGKLKLGGAEFAALAPDLLKLSKYQRTTLETLGLLGSEAGAAAPAVAEHLKTVDSYDRQKIFDLLLKFGPRAVDAVPVALEFLKEDEAYQRTRALNFLAAIGPPAAASGPAIKALIEKDNDRDVRKTAIAALSKIVPNDPSITETQLLELVDMREHEIAEWLKTQGTAAQPLVRNGLASTNAKIRRVCLSLLLPMNVSAERGVPIFTKALADTDPEVRRQAALELSELGQSSPQITELLLGGLREKENWRYTRALQNAGRSAMPLVCKTLLASKDPEAQEKNLNLLESLGARRPVAAPPELTAGLTSAEAETRELSALALTDLNCADDACGKIILELAAQPNKPRGKLALKALARRSYTDKLPVPANIVELCLAHLGKEDDWQSQRNMLLQTATLTDAQALKIAAALPTMEEPLEALQLLRKLKLSDPAPFVGPLSALLTSEKNQSSHACKQILQVMLKLGQPGVAAVLPLLNDDQAPASRRANILLALAESKPIPELQPALEKLCEHDEPQVRGLAALAIARNPDNWAKQLGTILEFAGLEDNDHRYQAFNVLHRTPAELLVPEILKQLQKPDRNKELDSSWLNQLRHASRESAAARSYLLERLVKTAASENGEKRELHLLQNWGPAGSKELLLAVQATQNKLTPELLKALRHQAWSPEDKASCLAWATTLLSSADAGLQLQAALLVTELEPANTTAATLLVEAYKRELASAATAESRRQYDSPLLEISEALEQMGPLAAPALPELIAQLRLDESSDLYSTCQTLQKMGAAAAPAVPRLIQLLEREKSFSLAANTLQKIGPGAAAAIPALQSYTKSEHRLHTAVGALSKIAADPKSYLPPLLAQTKDPLLGCATIEALGELGPHCGEALPLLLEILQASDPEKQAVAISALGNLKEHAVTAVDPLLALSAIGNTNVRRDAFAALGQIKAAPEKVMPALIAALDDRAVQQAVLTALQQYENEANPSLPALVKKLADPVLNEQIVYALCGINSPESRTVLFRLVKGEGLNIADHEQQQQLRFTIIAHLGQQSEHAEEIAPVLSELLADETVKDNAASALSRLDPAAAKAKGVYRDPQRNRYDDD